MAKKHKGVHPREQFRGLGGDCEQKIIVFRYELSYWLCNGRLGQRRNLPGAERLRENNKQNKGKPMHRALIVLPALLAFPLAGCVVGLASGEPYSESQRHAYANFSRVDVSAGIETVVNQGPFDVKAEARDGESFDRLIVEVQGDTLRISRKSDMFNWNGPHYRVTVSAPAYEGFGVSSGARLDGANLTLKGVRVNVSSGASATLSGACTTLDVNVSSGAHFDGEGLHCDSADIDASSGASADAFATQQADGSASSGASVTFHGQPAKFHEDSSSGGSVQAR